MEMVRGRKDNERGEKGNIKYMCQSITAGLIETENVQ